MADLKNIFPSEIIENTVEKHFQDYNPGRRVLYLIVLALFFVTLALMFIIKVDVSVRSTGAVRPLQNRTDIRAPVNGVIDSIFVHENTHVKAGDVLIKIYSQSVDNQSFALHTQHQELADEVSDLTLLLAGGNVRGLKSTMYPEQYQLYRQKLNDAQNKLDLVSKDFERYGKLYNSHVISAEEYEKYAYAMKSARNDLSTVRDQQYTQWQSDLTRIKLQMQDMNSQMGLYEEQKDLHVIKAPVSGTVQQMKGLQHGSVITPNDILGEISPDSGMIAEVYVMPKDIGYLKVGTPVRMQVDAFNYNMWGMITGKVSSISNDIFTDARQPYFKVRCKLDKQVLELKNGYKGYLKKGMTLQVRFFITKRTLFQLLYDKTDDWLNPNLIPASGQADAK